MILWAAVIALGKAVGMNALFRVIAWMGFAFTAAFWVKQTFDRFMHTTGKHNAK